MSDNKTQQPEPTKTNASDVQSKVRPVFTFLFLVNNADTERPSQQNRLTLLPMHPSLLPILENSTSRALGSRMDPLIRLLVDISTVERRYMLQRNSRGLTLGEKK
jgi:hypothetical protein